MPLGSSKISLGGADLVPGGNSTFNSSGTFVAPLGVSLVCATGFGGVGGTGDVGRGGNGGGGGGGGGGGRGSGEGGGPTEASSFIINGSMEELPSFRVCEW